MELESAKAVAIAYYESDGFELLCRDFECVDGCIGLVFTNGEVMRFVDVYDHNEELDDETESRVKAVVGNYLRKNPHPEVDRYKYDIVIVTESACGFLFKAYRGMMKVGVRDCIGKVIEDMRNYAEGGVSCVEDDMLTFAGRLEAIINSR